MRIALRARLFMQLRGLLGLLLGVCSPATHWAQELAQATALNQALREQVLMLPKRSGTATIELETTVFKPPGAGPFPLVVINHGKSPGPAREQARARYEWQAREFVQRGYMVVVPMRQGFSRSGGNYISAGCDVARNGHAHAQDIVAVLQALQQEADADVSRVLVIGQSHGGLATMAMASLKHPGVLGLINFSGGLRQGNCKGWETNLAQAFLGYGRNASVPSLWFYGDNDSYWSPALYREMHGNYLSSGGQARLVSYGEFGRDAHGMFISRAGRALWWPEVERFLGELGLTTGKLHSIPLMAHSEPVPAATRFAALDDAAALPYVKQAAREGYTKYLGLDSPKAFAISANGAWAYVAGQAQAMASALTRCQQYAKGLSCSLYAVDEQVVWPVP